DRLDRLFARSACHEETAVSDPATHWQSSRREFFRGSLATTAAVLGSDVLSVASDAPAASERPAKVIDCHGHLHHHSISSWEADARALIDAADRLKIDQLCCSILTPKRPATVAGFRDCNRWVLDAMKRYPDRVLGYCYVNPGFTKEAVEEVRRCVEMHGFV